MKLEELPHRMFACLEQTSTGITAGLGFRALAAEVIRSSEVPELVSRWLETVAWIFIEFGDKSLRDDLVAFIEPAAPIMKRMLATMKTSEAAAFASRMQHVSMLLQGPESRTQIEADPSTQVRSSPLARFVLNKKS